ncbi:MAG: hypothetical protein FKY71_17635 [Spiribacter salinus]|uniref:Uncharacterized protein n=1 Tax=Spiribacter salinus TaxID=1335746 RepID=A0A540VCI4_9GAMM|nr:MAG: hypothetical protein FKY71_17635 [Spiribacter salinus]
MKRIIEALIATTFLITANLAVSQSAPQEDLLAAPPELVVVEKVDATQGRVVINGQEFELYDGDRSLFALPREADQLEVSITELRPGAEVMVVTDGTESSRDRLAKIIAMWRPR